MRLQVAIHRHSLPAIHIVFSTGTGPASHTASPSTATIADLLADINDVVPLESADGEWGLEDYVVEVAATADQDHSYECLHFQGVESVLREDDEVVVRALTTEELRSRRLGGRHQISGDGRHLIDGVSFGRRWVRKGGRPGLLIPPRKKRRLLEMDDPGDGEEEEVQALMESEEDDGELALLDILDEEEKDDDDDEEDSTFEANDEEGEYNPLQIVAKADFDDADEPEDDEEDEQVEDEDEEDSDYELQEELELSDELKALLEDAEGELMNGEANAESLLDAVVEAAADEFLNVGIDEEELLQADIEDIEGNNLSADGMVEELAEAEAPSTPRTGKRKRELEDEAGDFSEEESEFEGFSTPRFKGGIILYGEDEPTSTSGSSPSSSSDAELKAEFEAAAPNAEVLMEDVLPVSNGHYDSTTSSSSEEFDSEADADLESLAESTSTDDESSADDSDSTSTFSSSSSESSSDEDPEAENTQVPKIVSEQSPQVKSSTTATTTDSSTNLKQTPPGKGSSRTRSNNFRHKMKKRLLSFKRQGLLPSDANFDDLRAFDRSQADSGVWDHQESDEIIDQMFEEKKQELLDRLRAQSEQEEASDDPISAETGNEVSNLPQQSTVLEEKTTIETVSQKNVSGAFIGPIIQDQDENMDTSGTGQRETPSTPKGVETIDLKETMSEPPQKRARLDLASTRRMLFSSLGLRNPKTADDEQTLRQKLSKDVRQDSSKRSTDADQVEEARTETHKESVGEKDWKEKIILTAVECEMDGIVITTPPFPFEQGWDEAANRRRSKKRARNQQQYYQEDYGAADEGTKDENEFAPDMSFQYEGDENTNKSEPINESRTLSADNAHADDLPAPADFAILESLTKEMILPESIVAFRELHMNDKWEPEISAYRVAKIIGFTDDGLIQFRLSKRDRQMRAVGKIDDETGERLYSGFEAPEEDTEEEDSGERVMSLEDFIEAKLIETGRSQPGKAIVVLVEESSSVLPSVPESIIIPNSADEKEIMPITAISEIEVSSSRREEITGMIKEAGFDSILDEQLLQPLTALDAEKRQAMSPRLPVTRPNEVSSDNHPELQLDNTHTTVDPSGLESPHFNGWSSSPTREPGRGLIGNDAFDENWQSSSVSGQSQQEIPHSAKTITYPPLSQLDIKASSMATTDNSSSHQDAQRLSHLSVTDISVIPTIGHDDVRGLGEAEEDEAVDTEGKDDEPLESLKSTVQQSDGVYEDRDSSFHPSSPTSDSFLGGRAGHASSGDDQGYDDDSDLPSLRQITSSQIERPASVSRTSNISPPPLKKGLRNGKHRRSRSPVPSQDPLAASQVNIKLSQPSLPSLSQIPAEKGPIEVVDLTFSSDVATPDENSWNHGGTKQMARRTRGLNGVNPRAAKAEKSEGLGTKRYLTTKKSKSKV